MYSDKNERRRLFKASQSTKQRFSLRKLSFGAASVLVGTLLFMGGQVSADEQVSETTASGMVMPSEAEDTSLSEEPASETPVAVVKSTEASETSVLPSSDTEEPVVETGKADVSSEVDKAAETTEKPQTPRFKADNTLPADLTNNAMPRPENEGEAFAEGTGFRAGEHTSDIVDGSRTPIPSTNGFSISDGKLPAPYTGFSDPNAGRTSFAMVENYGNGQKITLSTDDAGNVYVTEAGYARFVPKSGTRIAVNGGRNQVYYNSGNQRYYIVSTTTGTDTKNATYSRVRDGYVTHEPFAKDSNSFIAPVKTNQVTEFVYKETNERVYADYTQAAKTGDRYTTVPVPKDGFDVWARHNQDGVVTQLGHYGKGSVLNLGQTNYGRYTERIEGRVIDDDGNIEVTVYWNNVPQTVYAEVPEKTYTDGSGRRWPVYRSTGSTSAIIYNPLKLSSASPNTPTTVVFSPYGGSSFNDTLRRNRTIASNEIVENSYRAYPTLPSSDHVRYYYTREKAEVIFYDVTDPNNRILLNDKISANPDSGFLYGKSQTGVVRPDAEIKAILDKYAAQGYRLATTEDRVDYGDGFTLNPQYNALNKTFVDPVTGETRDIFDAKDDDNQSADREKKRQEANKKVIEIRIVRDQAAKVIYYDKTDGNKKLSESTIVVGKTNAAINQALAKEQGHDVAATIANYEKQGYKLATSGSDGQAPANGFDLNPTFDSVANNVQEIKIYLEHKTTTPDQPDWPADVAKTKEEVRRTVHYVYDKTSPNYNADPAKNVAAPDHTDVLKFVRKDTVDLVTKEVTPGQWHVVTREGQNGQPDTLGQETGSFASVTSPPIEGHTPDKATDGEYSVVRATDIDKDSTVVYKPKLQAAQLTYWLEKDGQEVALPAKDAVAPQDITNGVAGQTITFSNQEANTTALIKKGYEVVDAKTYQGGATFNNVDGYVQPFKVVVKEKIVPITEPKVPGDPVNPNDPKTPNWPEPSDPDAKKSTSFKEEVKRTVHYHKIDDLNATADNFDKTATTEVTTEKSENKVNFTRKGTINLVTGEVTWEPWVAKNNDTTLEGKTLPVIPGYEAFVATITATVNGQEGTANYPTVAATEINFTVKATDSDMVENVYYKPKPQKAIVKYYDESGNNAKLTESEQSTGIAGKDIPSTTRTPQADTTDATIQYYKDRGYALVSNGFNQAPKYDTEDGNVQEIPVVLKHDEIEVPPTAPKTPNDPLHPNVPDTDKPKYPTGVSESDLNKTITRDIRYWYLNVDGTKAFDTVTQTVTFTRKAYVDSVTGKLLRYSDWETTNADLPAVTSPDAPAGYVVDRATVPVQTVPNTQPDKYKYIENVIYTPKDQVAKLTYYVQREDKTREELPADLAPVEKVTGKTNGIIKFPNQKATTDKLIAKGYEVVEAYDGNATFDNVDGNEQPYIVVVKERVVPFTEPPTPEKPVDPKVPVDPKYPEDPDDPNKKDTAFTETVTRTIKYYKTDASGDKETAKEVTEEMVTETVNFARTGKINLVTGEVTWNPWTPETNDLAGKSLPTDKTNEAFKGYEAFDADAFAVVDGEEIVVPGYKHTLAATTEDITVEANNPDTLEKVYYRPKQQLAVVKYYKDTKAESNLLATSNQVTGIVDETIPQTPATPNKGDDVEATIKYFTDRGYELVSNGFVETPKYDDVDGNVQEVPIVLRETVITIPPTDPKTPNDPIHPDPNTPTEPIPDSPKYPKGVSEKDLNKTIKREIRYWYETVGGEVASQTVVQEVKFTRSAKVNAVTGAFIEYTEWTPADNTMPEVTSPVSGAEGSSVKAGYTVDKATVPVQTVPSATEDQKGEDNQDIPEYIEDVIYKPVPKDVQEADLKFFVVDADGTSNKTTAPNTTTYEATGTEGEPITFTDYATKLKDLQDAGYVVVTDGFANGGTFDNDKTEKQHFEVVLKPRIDDKDNETKTITRTITYETQDKNGGNSQQLTDLTYTNTVTYTRTVKQNAVTKEFIYGEWTSTDKVLEGNTLPTIADYTVFSSTRDNAAQEATKTTEIITTTADTDDVVEHVIYRPTAKPQTADLTYYLQKEDNQPLEKLTDYPVEEVTGATGETIKFPSQAANVAALKKKGYEVIEEYGSNQTFDDVDDEAGSNSQSYRVVVKERVVPIDKPIEPGKPVDPNKPKDPETPNWPDNPTDPDVTKESAFNETVTRTITYYTTDKDGNLDTAVEVTGTKHTETVTFKRTGKINLVTGEVTWDKVEGEEDWQKQGWTAENNDATLNGNPLPTVDGYEVFKSSRQWGTGLTTFNDLQDSTKDVGPVTPTSEDLVEKVYFKPVVKNGSVIITYVDEEGNKIKEPVKDVTDVPEDTPYDATENDEKPSTITTTDGKEYVFVKVGENSAPVADKVKPGESTVIYVYKEKDKGNVVVHYRIQGDENTVIKDPVNDMTDAYVDTPYNTKDKIEAQITYDGKTYVLVPGVVKGDEEGNVTKETINVTYYYKLQETVPPAVEYGDVIVKYVKQGTDDEIADQVAAENNKLYNSGYNTQKFATKEIVSNKDGKTYVLVGVKDGSATEEGIVDKPLTTVVYEYVEKAKGDVVVKYVIDGTTTELKDPVKDVDQAYVGTDYDTTDRIEDSLVKDGKIYDLIREDGTPKHTGEESGKVQEEGTVVTYYYKLREEVKGSVLVHYITEKGEILAPTVTDTDDKPVNDAPNAYDTSELRRETIVKDGKTYVLVADKHGQTATGQAFTVADGAPAEMGPIVEGTTHVTYVYKEVVPPVVKEGKVTVHYEDENGNEIKDPVEDTPTSPEGTPYETFEHKTPNITKDQKEYVLVGLKKGSNPEKGTVKEGDTVVTYVYREKAKGSVVVNYRIQGDETTVIKSSVDDVRDVYIGTAYNTTEHKTPEITYGNKVYVLVPNVVKGEEIGTVTEATKEVTYYYQEKAKGSVVVNYISTDGTEIKQPETDTASAYVGTAYDTTDNGLRPETITFGGKTYERVPRLTQGKETGEVVEGTTTITYVYKEVDAPVIPPVVKEEADLTFLLEKDGNQTRFSEIPVVTVTGENGGSILFPTYEDTLKALRKRGYEVKTDDYNGTGTFDNDPTVKQHFTVVLVEKVTPFTPEDPGKPGKPIDPKNPEGPKWPNDPRVTDLTREITRTVSYEKLTKDGQPDGEVAPTVTNKVVYTRSGEINHVTGDITITQDWTAKANDTVLDGNPLPGKSGVLTGYVIVNSERDGVKIDHTETTKDITTTPTSHNVVEKVVYQPMGSWIPNLPDTPTEEYPKQPYPNDPEDPTKPGDPTEPSVPPIPYVPGYEPKDPSTGEPLKPKDPEDPTKGYVPPTTPEDPTTDINIPYVAIKGKVLVHYRDTDGNIIKDDYEDTSLTIIGKDYNTAENDTEKPTEIVRDGYKYVLVPSKTVGMEQGKVVEGETHVTYVYQKVANWIPLIPGEPNPPKNPYPFDPEHPDKPINPTPEVPGKPGTPTVPYVPGYEPKDPKTGQPLPPADKDNPDKGYIPPVPKNPGQDTYIPYVPVPPTPEAKKGSVVVHYQDTKGNIIASDVIDEANKPVGEEYDTTDHKPSTIKRGEETYVLVPSETKGNEKGMIKEGTIDITYVYQKVGNWIPELPGKEWPKNPYPFDPENPGNPIKPVPEVPGEPGQPGVPTVPHEPGYVPVDPETKKPLPPVDKDNPDKGYIPPVPKNPGEDTHIPYVPVGQVVVRYHDTEGNEIKKPVVDTPKSFVDTDYDTTDNKPTEIITSDGSRYVLVPSKTVGSETGKVVEGETHVTYVYQKVGNWIPLIPGDPNPPKKPYPFDPEHPENPIPQDPGKPGDPTIPYVPGYEPKDPNTGEPLKPKNPNDPKEGYIPPAPTTPGEDTPIPYVPVSPKPTPEPGKPTPPTTPDPKEPTPEEPKTPETPNVPDQPGKPAEPAKMTELPSTGDAASTAAGAMGLASILAAFGLGKKRRKED